jgi:ribulose-phosphate 3-epimerase
MDGHFVPNLTMGPDMVRGVRRACSGAFIDVHMMVTDPWLYASAFVQAGADHLTFHVEVIPPGEIPGLAKKIRELGVTVGLALNPETPVEDVMPHLDHFDLILVMSVHPGKSGQAFIADVLSKTQTISDELTPNQRLEMDGGIKPENVESCLDAGCDVVVAASAVFGVPPAERGKVVAALRGG